LFTAGTVWATAPRIGGSSARRAAGEVTVRGSLFGSGRFPANLDPLSLQGLDQNLLWYRELE
jgi:hypothetical protein